MRLATVPGLLCALLALLTACGSDNSSADTSPTIETQTETSASATLGGAEAASNTVQPTNAATNTVTPTEAPTSAPTDTPVPPTDTPPLPTNTPVPPTNTPLPTNTPTSIPPTATATPTSAPVQNCSPAYPDFCIPPPPPDLDCGDIGAKNFTVLAPDPHRFDGDHDGIGCES